MAKYILLGRKCDDAIQQNNRKSKPISNIDKKKFISHFPEKLLQLTITNYFLILRLEKKTMKTTLFKKGKYSKDFKHYFKQSLESDITCISVFRI